MKPSACAATLAAAALLTSLTTTTPAQAASLPGVDMEALVKAAQIDPRRASEKPTPGAKASVLLVERVPAPLTPPGPRNKHAGTIPAKRKGRNTMGTTLNKVLSVAAAAAAIGGTAVAAAPPASAADRDGKCDSGEFCYYFNSGNKGSVSDFRGSVADYGAKQPGCYEFKGQGSGKGKCVKNAAASVWNRTGQTVRVYYNSDHGGIYQDFKKGEKGDLNPRLKNQNASHELSPRNRVNMSFALYQARGGRLTCPFDGYQHRSGRHEGIDFARSRGSNVYALVSGKVTRVVEGRDGGAGLSTIAVYNASLRRTVIYLHTDPRNSLRAGQSIRKGQVIANEAWRGVSSSSSAHTHVEMRPGRQTHASPSGDEHLANPNPNSFWRSQGYNVR
ncbi:peptidase inhibitor family I36 protein [Actinomadura litoris]|nr:peptidase inhibitor family I36 protein [Actinomadura litoris]